MYLDKLKELYYHERLKLEEMDIFTKESEFQILRLRTDILEKLENRLSISELEGREDIKEEIKDALLRDPDKQEKVAERIQNNIENERQMLANEEKDNLKRLGYSPEDYANYIYQSEKVFLLENALEEERLFPSDVYEEMKQKFYQSK